MVIDKWKLRKTLLQSWGFTLMGLFNILAILLICSMIAIRMAGPGAFMAILMPSIAFVILIFFIGEIVVNIIFDAESPDPEHDKRFIESMRRVKKKTRMWVMPRAWVLDIGSPNAMAYGPGIPGMCAVGVSRELVDLLTDDELDGVIAHEFAHIKCRDTGILAVISFVIGMIDKLRKLLENDQAMIRQSPITLVLGWLIYYLGRFAFAISRFSISQEREIAADALSAGYNDDAKPLISALRKLHALGKKNRSEDQPEPIFKDLMVAHPGLEERIESLENLEVKPLLYIEHKGSDDESNGPNVGVSLR